MIELNHIDSIIKTHDRSIQLRFYYTGFIFIIGISILILSYLNLLGESADDIAKIGSALVISITAWPVKEIIDKRSSQKIFKAMKADIISLQKKNEEHIEEIEKMKGIIWLAIEKLAVG
jgi:hypothetical protein